MISRFALAALLGVSMILGGINLVMTGLLAEMLSRTYHESQDKPPYHVRQRIAGPGQRPHT